MVRRLGCDVLIPKRDAQDPNVCRNPRFWRARLGLFQFREFVLGLCEDGDVGVGIFKVGIFKQDEEILISRHEPRDRAHFTCGALRCLALRQGASHAVGPASRFSSDESQAACTHHPQFFSDAGLLLLPSSARCRFSVFRLVHNQRGREPTDRASWDRFSCRRDAASPS